MFIFSLTRGLDLVSVHDALRDAADLLSFAIDSALLNLPRCADRTELNGLTSYSIYVALRLLFSRSTHNAFNRPVHLFSCHCIETATCFRAYLTGRIL